MNRFGRGALAGLMLTAAVAGKASATIWGGNGPWCGGSGFSTCFSVDLQWTAAAGQTLVVTLKLRNDNPDPDLKWFQVGLDHLTNGLTGSSERSVTGSSVSGPTDWGNPPPNDFGGGPIVDPVASSDYEGSGGGESNIPTNIFRTWTFTLTGNTAAFSAADWDALLQGAGVGIHAGGLECGSTKVIVRDDLASGSAYGANSNPDGTECDQPSPPTEITPEPMTMSLMALGLVGLGGAGLIRRRRKV